MPLSKSDLAAIEDFISVSFAERLGEMRKDLAGSLALIDARILELEKRVERRLADISSNLESLRDVLSE